MTCSRMKRIVLVLATPAVAALVGSSGCILFAATEFGRRMQAAIDALPEVNVRIVNHTAVPARIELDSGISPPEGTMFDWMMPPEAGLMPADFKSVVVAPGGTVTGTVKCGEVIAISAVTPGDMDTFYGESESAFGFYASAGDIAFSGAGASASAASGFSGDVQSTGQARFIRPADDGLDCSSGTIVVDIQTAGTIGTLNAQTGTYSGGTTGSGTVSIE